MIKLSNEVADLFQAMSLAQSELEHVEKSSKVNMELKSGRIVKYNYAELCDVQEALKAPFKNHGLFYTQFPVVFEGKTYLETLIGHKSGQYMSGLMPLSFEGKGPQDIGSLLTYFRRYALSAAAGVTQQDDDGNTAQGNKATINKKTEIAPVTAPSDYVIPMGKNKGKKLSEVDSSSLMSLHDYLEKAEKRNEAGEECLTYLKKYLGLENG